MNLFVCFLVDFLGFIAFSSPWQFLVSSELYNIMFAASKGDFPHCRESTSQYASQILLVLIPLATMISGILVNLNPSFSAF